MNLDSPNAPVRKSFRERANGAAFWESWVGAVLRRKGLYVTLNPFVIDGQDHGLSHDLDVSSVHPQEMSDASGPEPLEVKSVNLDFTSPQNYPYDKVLLCSQNSFLRKWPGSSVSGSDFAMVSRITGHMVFVPRGTPVELGNETLDHSRGELYKTVTVHKSSLNTLDAYVAKFGTGRV